MRCAYFLKKMFSRNFDWFSMDLKIIFGTLGIVKFWCSLRIYISLVIKTNSRLSNVKWNAQSAPVERPWAGKGGGGGGREAGRQGGREGVIVHTSEQTKGCFYYYCDFYFYTYSVKVLFPSKSNSETNLISFRWHRAHINNSKTLNIY